MTRKVIDPFEVSAVAHLVSAQDARERYDQTLRAAIATYGDVQGPIIAGVYSGHFPEHIKSQLRTYARLIGEHSHLSLLCWERAGRRLQTWRPIADQYRRLSDGRVSYY